jgi:D-arginine dehydrogenase
VVAALAAVSSEFLAAPPDGFAEHPLTTPRGLLLLGRADQHDGLRALYRRFEATVDGLRLVDAAEAERLLPVLRPGYAAGGVYEPGARDLDVHGLHQGYLRALRRYGGTVVTGAEVQRLALAGGMWRVRSSAGTFEAGTVVNAAGAWADQLAGLAGLSALGLRALRRTIVVFDPPAGTDPGAWPMTVDVDEAFYLRPEGGRVLASPADETPVPPCDVQPEEVDVAVAVDRVERATTLRVDAIRSKWAGLRTFAPDRLPVLGPDPRVAGFSWMAGQGGNGIMAGPAMAAAAASLTLGRGVPEALAAAGVSAEQLVPDRLLGA